MPVRCGVGMLGTRYAERARETMGLLITFSIGDAAEASGLSIKTIRYYEEIGLIPKSARKEGGPHARGHRIYSQEEVARMRFIHHARLFGLPLAEIRNLLALADGKGCPSGQPEYRDILKKHLHEIDERIQHLLGLRSAIEDLIAPARRSESEKCSWGTCACMGPADGVQQPRRKGANHV